MTTRSEDEMLALITEFAEAEDHIRVVLINGSRANPAAYKDPFQDYDIATYVTDVQPFRDMEYVVPRFGDTIVVEQPLIGPWPPADHGEDYHNYNIQLLDGNRIDLSFYRIESLPAHLTDSLTAVILDKDGRVPALPPPDVSSYLISKPSEELYQGCCTGFFFALGSHIPKTIWRKKLPLLKSLIEAWLRETVVMMLGWEIGIRKGWGNSLGQKGKHLKSLLPPEIWTEYKSTFVDYDYENIWDSLFLFHRIFVKSAEFVANERGYRFPSDMASKVLAFLRHVRAMPEDAKRIY